MRFYRMKFIWDLTDNVERAIRPNEGKFQLGQFVAFYAKLRHALDKLLEIDLPIAVRVENVDHTLHQRVLLQLWQGHKLIDAEGARIVEIQFLEAFAQSTDFVRVNWKYSERMLPR